MAKYNLYQIYYNEETRASLDSGFIPLDNTTNLRPDWGEFFVIRHFLRNNPLNEDEKYGFFSPKFQQKTGLSSSQVHEFIESTPENTDVVIFSPFWEMISFFKNVFEQGNFWHPGLINASQNFFLEAGRYHEVNNLLMHRKNTVFCNYFAASPAFWRSWLKIGDLLFDYSEDKNHPLNLLLNQRTYHDNHDGYSLKIFLQERLASYLLTTEHWNTENYPIFQMKSSTDDLKYFSRPLIYLDSLKEKYSITQNQNFIHEYFQLRGELAAHLKIQLS